MLHLTIMVGKNVINEKFTFWVLVVNNEYYNPNILKNYVEN
jgi:hypothetical protein